MRLNKYCILYIQVHLRGFFFRLLFFRFASVSTFSFYLRSECVGSNLKTTKCACHRTYFAYSSCRWLLLSLKSLLLFLKSVANILIIICCVHVSQIESARQCAFRNRKSIPRWLALPRLNRLTNMHAWIQPSAWIIHPSFTGNALRTK